jgi:outer membrane protein OmpA-like peptidoglycan-associated protein
VKEYLIEHGINENRISAKGFGHTQPISTEKTAEAHAKNRRVEFEFSK